MRTFRTVGPVLVVLVAGALPASEASADTPVADTPIAGTTAGTSMSAYGGMTAWSQLDPVTGRYRLALRTKGKTTIPTIDSRLSPFDVSVGPNTKNRPVALYSRCSAKDETTDCDAYKYDPHDKREQKLTSVSRDDQDEAWPSQWKANYAFARVIYSGGRTQTNRCDAPFTRPIRSGYGVRTVQLARGSCGIITGQALRGTILVGTVLSFPSGSNRTEVRRRSIKGGASKLLARRTFTKPSDVYGAPSIDGNYVYLTRTGAGPTPRFIRLRRDTGSRTEVEAQTTLAGAMARENGRTTYLEVQGAAPGEPCGPVTPCRIVVAGADPFSSRSRALAPRLTLGPPGVGLLGNQPLVVTGGLTRPIVQEGKVTGSQPVSGMPLEILRAAYAPTPSGQSLAPTGVRSTTGADGGWGLAVPPPLPVFGYYAAVTRGSGIAAQAAVVALKTSASVTLDAAPRSVAGGETVTFTGAVAPIQPGRNVNIVEQLAPGVNQVVASAPVGADGSFSAVAPVTRSGSYVAELPPNPFDGSDGNATYSGASAPVGVSVAP